MTLSAPWHPLRPRSNRYRLVAAVLWTFWSLAPVVIAQPAINTIADGGGLPLRNLLVEMRQVAVAQAAEQGLGADGRLHSDQTHSVVTAQQQVLVLNGRQGIVALQTLVPMRLVAVVFRNGQPVRVAGVAQLPATTGFRVLPRWDGAEGVELELTASQAGLGQPASPGATAASTVWLPIGEWSVVAQSEGGQTHQQGGLPGVRAVESSHRYELQARISVR